VGRHAALATGVARAHAAGHRVLFHYHAGYSRSGLLVGLALVAMGWDRPAAVDLIRH
jgi:protein-tyrosine phosphatase